MEKQKLADLVLQKMKEKKQQEEKNRPHYEVLRLQATFQKEIHDQLKQEISQLQSMLNNERQALNELQKHQNQLDNTGKKNYPRIIIMPDFIASEKISSSIKEFYRKTSNSFLRTDILRTKSYNESAEREKQFLQKLALVEELENQIRKNGDQDIRILNLKRIKVLKQDLRLRSIIEQQKQIQRTIEKEKDDNKDLLNQYDIKKNNLQNRKNRLKYVQEQIQAFNPVAYREHLQSIFDIKIKTQRMHNHLTEVVQKTGRIEKETQKYQKILQKTASLSFLGRTSDSPSTKRGRIQKRLDQQKQRSKQNVKRALTQRIGQQQSHKRSLSNQSIKKQPLDLDLLQMISTAKNSQKTTDRSSHPTFNSQIARSLF